MHWRLIKFLIDPGKKPEQIKPEGKLDGKDVLPGFELTLVELFATADAMSGS